MDEDIQARHKLRLEVKEILTKQKGAGAHLAEFLKQERERGAPIDLSDLDFSGLSLAKMDFSDIVLRDADFSYKIKKPGETTKADNANGIKPTNLESACFVRAQLNGALFVCTSAKKASFFCADLSRVRALRANFEGADFAQTLLCKAHAEKAVFKRCHFNGANLHGACLEGADFTGATMIYTNLDAADLRNARGLETITQYEGVILSRDTRLSEDAPDWMKELYDVATDKRNTTGYAVWLEGKAQRCQQAPDSPSAQIVSVRLQGPVRGNEHQRQH